MTRYLTTAEAAAYCGLKTETFRSYSSRGDAGCPKPAKHVGRTPLWDEAEIRDWYISRPRLYRWRIRWRGEDIYVSGPSLDSREVAGTLTDYPVMSAGPQRVSDWRDLQIGESDALEVSTAAGTLHYRVERVPLDAGI